MFTAALVYKDDLFGDKSQTISLYFLCDKQVFLQQHEKGMVKYKKELIYNKKIRHNIELPTNDPYFKSFNAQVNDECENSITDMYGKFSPLPSPILTEEVLSYFYERFRVTFPTQYKSIVCFLNKVVSFNHEIVKNNHFLWTVMHYTSSVF